MSKEFDLDSLKSAWQEQTNEKNYSSNEIFQMLKRKSMTSVKWIFTISIIEILIGFIFYLVSIIYPDIFSQYSNYDNAFMNYVLIGMSIIGYLVTFYFVYKFFNSYKAISAQSTVKDLSLDIINFRKVVNKFIYFNLTLFIVAVVVSLVATLNYDPHFVNLKFSSPEQYIGFIVGIVVMFLLIFFIIWLYYYLVYGTFLRKLKRNLKELEVIE